MKIYKTQQEVEKDIVNRVLAIDDDVIFECNISIDASINAWNINARDINAWDINALNINARDINAWNINALNINARDISYHAFCQSYNSIKCTLIKARRDNHSKPICLDGKLEIIPKDEEIEQAIKLLEAKGRLKDGKILRLTA